MGIVLNLTRSIHAIVFEVNLESRAGGAPAYAVLRTAA